MNRKDVGTILPSAWSFDFWRQDFAFPCFAEIEANLQQVSKIERNVGGAKDVDENKMLKNRSLKGEDYSKGGTKGKQCVQSSSLKGLAGHFDVGKDTRIDISMIQRKAHVET